MSTVTPIAADGRGLPPGVTYDSSLGLITYQGRQVPAQSYEGALAVVRAIDSRQPVVYQDYNKNVGAITRTFDPVLNTRSTAPADSATVVSPPLPQNPAPGLTDNPTNLVSPPVITTFDEFGTIITQTTPVEPPQTTVVPIPPQPVSVGTVPRDDPQAGEAEARAFIANRSPAPLGATESEVLPGFTADSRAAGENVGSVLERSAAPVNPNPWAGRDAEKAAAWAQLSPADQRWLGDANPTDEFILRRAPNRGVPEQALVSVQNLSPESVPLPDDNLGFEPLPDDNLAFTQGVNPGPGYIDTFDEFGNPVTLPAQLPDDNLAFREGVDPGPGYGVSDDNLGFEQLPDDNLAFSEEATAAAATTAALRERAQIQAVLDNQQRQADSGDWRFKIRLAPGARYLYRGEDGQGVSTGILAPLAVTDGVVFPYTPNVTTSYIAKYVEQDLPHSNYRGYFYSGSHPEGVTVESVFTAQDTREANYLLAVIHFFRSVTKMFYGQSDSFRGAPPPLVFLQGFGAYQYSRHPCVVTRFNYRLPSDVDYIRADVQPITGLNIQQGRRPGGVPPQSLPTNVFTGAMGRLAAAGVPKGAIYVPPPADTLGTRSPTYVPTKMDITLELLPMQTRQQVSQVFNMRDFASGSLLRKGFW